MNNSNIFKLNFKDVVSALLNGVFVGVVGYLGSVASIYAIDPQQLLSVAILAAVGSLAKSFTSDGKGKVFGKIG